MQSKRKIEQNYAPQPTLVVNLNIGVHGNQTEEESSSPSSQPSRSGIGLNLRAFMCFAMIGSFDSIVVRGFNRIKIFQREGG
jgi:hypothetical protein